MKSRNASADEVDTFILAIASALPKVKDHVTLNVIASDTRLYRSEREFTPGLELDSLDALELVCILEEDFGVSIVDDVSPDRFETVGDLARFMAEQVATGACERVDPA